MFHSPAAQKINNSSLPWNGKPRNEERLAGSSSEPQLQMNIGTTRVWMPSKKRTVKRQENLFIINYMENMHLSLTLIAVMNYCRLNCEGRHLNMLSLHCKKASTMLHLKSTWNHISRPGFYCAQFISARYCKENMVVFIIFPQNMNVCIVLMLTNNQI